MPREGDATRRQRRRHWWTRRGESRGDQPPERRLKASALISLYRVRQGRSRQVSNSPKHLRVEYPTNT